jgi:hypothetical protein
MNRARGMHRTKIPLSNVYLETARNKSNCKEIMAEN